MALILILTSIMMFSMSLSLMNMNMFMCMNIPLLHFLSFNININLIFDWTSCIFLSSVMFISSMIVMFSMYYIPNKQKSLFIILLFMFILSMMILIISNNIFIMLLGWDMLGLSSYILVVYYQNFNTAASGSITLLSNRMGDILILLSISTLTTLKSWNFMLNKNFPIIILLMLMLAACSKSAQYPFSAWLPMAMAAPTPISALVHSSTLVTAGVFLLIRIMDNMHPTSMLLLMMLSSATMLYSSMSANWEQDLKKIIALSTLSQIAMMMFAISINTINMAFMHLIIHALFKSTMFLCAGIIIHETSFQDTRMMGLNTYNLPLASSIMGITSLSLMGMPFMSSFFSKDIIIEKMMSSKLECLLTLMMFISIMLTCMYSTRMSIMANKLSMKSMPNSTNHFSMYYNMPLSIMSMISIMSGSSLMWMINPEQTMYFPLKLKYLITIIILTTITFSTHLLYKNKSFNNLGIPSISLWFNHYTTTYINTLINPLTTIYTNNDKTWQESYGPNMSFLMTKMVSKTTETHKLLPLLILSMTLFIIMLLMY